MSLSPNQFYPGSTAVDSNFKDGKYKDSSAAEVYDGTPLDSLLFNQQLALNDAIMNEADMEYNGVVDAPATSQLFAAMLARKEVYNLLSENQNFNIPSGTQQGDLPSSTPTTYTVGGFMCKDRQIVFNDLVNATYIDGIFSADSGSYRSSYDGDFTDHFFGVKLEDGSITQSGVSISYSSTFDKTRVDVNVATVGPHKFVGLSAFRGVWPDISPDMSKELSIYGKVRVSDGGGELTQTFEELQFALDRVNLLKPTLVVSSAGYTANGDEPDTVVTSTVLTQNVETDKRYVLLNPFGDNVRFRAEAELFINGIWTPIASGESENRDGTGVIAGYVRDEGLVVQTGRDQLSRNSNGTLNLSGDNNLLLTTAPCRIWCYRDAV